MEMYGRAWRVMRIPQIMGWWGIVLIQQTNAADTKLPFWRKGKEPVISRSNGEAVWAWWCFLGGGGDPTVLRVWGFCMCECMKIPVSEIGSNSVDVIIRVSSYPNTAHSRVFF